MAEFDMDDVEATVLLEWYDPDTDGRLIYEFAERDNAIVEEGSCYYSVNNYNI